MFYSLKGLEQIHAEGREVDGERYRSRIGNYSFFVFPRLYRWHCICHLGNCHYAESDEGEK
jgi:hypothetical protein